MSNLIGKKAPAISGENQHGKAINLSDFIGQKVVIYFYPKDNTPGCTVQSCNLRDNYKSLQEKGIAIIGISKDDVKSHDKFATRFELPFDLIADEDRKAIEAYEVWGEKSLFGVKYMGTKRETFVVDENGIVILHIDKVKTKEHSAQIIDALDKLN